MSANKIPSIWLGDFHSKAEYDENAPKLAAAFSVYDWIDDRLLHSRHAFTFPGSVDENFGNEAAFESAG